MPRPDPVPLETLLEHRAWVRALARRLVREPSEAEDLEQEAWLAALKRPPGPGNPRAWLGAVLRRAAAGLRRREGRLARRAAAAPRGRPPAPADEVLAQAEEHRHLVEALVGLTEPYRTTLLLRYFEGLAPREVARRMEAPVETVRARTRRGLVHLRAALAARPGAGRGWRRGLVLLAGLEPEAPGRLAPPQVTTETAAAAAGGALMGKAVAVGLVGLFLFGAAWLVWPGESGPQTLPPGPVAEGDAPAPAQGAPEGVAPALAQGTGAPAGGPPAAGGAPAPPAVALRFVDARGAPLDLDAARGLLGEIPAALALTWVREDHLDPADWLRAQVAPDAGALVPAAARVEAGTLLLDPPPGAGPWRLLASHAAFEPLLLAVGSGPEGPAASLVLVQAARRRVRCLDAHSGVPLAGATLTPFLELGDDEVFLRGTPVRADARGEVDLPLPRGEPPGRRPATWWIETPEHLGRVSLAAAPERTEPLEVRVDRRARVRGEAFASDGSPARGCEVLSSRKGLTFRVRTNDAGRFELAAAHLTTPVGRRPATARLRLIESLEPLRITEHKVAVEPGAVAEVRLGTPGREARGASLTGRITAGGAPLEGLVLGVRGAPGLEAKGDGALARTDADGRYAFEGLEPGPVRLHVWLGDPRLCDDFAVHSAQEPGAAALVLEEGAPRALDLDLPGGALQVTVLDEHGQPLPQVVVLARPEQRGLEADRFPGLRFAMGWCGRTDARGRVLLRALTPGEPFRLEGGAADRSWTFEERDVRAGSTARPAEVTIRRPAR